MASVALERCFINGDQLTWPISNTPLASSMRISATVPTGASLAASNTVRLTSAGLACSVSRCCSIAAGVSGRSIDR